MRSTRAKTTLLAFFWALSVAAFCVTLGGAGVADETGVSWTRTLPYTGVWLIAAIGLGLGYRLLGKRSRALARWRLWVLAVFLAAVGTLAESFAKAGTAELVTGRPWLALLYFAGRVPACYMGMALLSEALASRRPSPGRGIMAPGKPAAQQAPLTYPTWAVNANRQSSVRQQQPTQPYTPPLPEWVAKPEQTQWTAEGGVTPADYSTGEMPDDRPETNESQRKETPARSAAAYRRTDTARGAWAYHTTRETGDYVLPPPERRGGVPVWGWTLLLLVCWLPYLFAVWPGTVSNDSITQLAMIFGRKPLSNGNPLAQTGILWLAVTAGKGIFHSANAAVALYVCVQALLMAWLLGYTLSRMAEASAPGWLTWLAAAFYALCPIFPVFAFCVGKDTLFAMAVLWFTLMVWRVASSKWPPFRSVVGLCLSAVACALLRNAGAVLAGITLLVLLIRAFTVRTKQWRAPLWALLAMGAVMAALYIVAIPGLHVETAAETENWSVPLQQVARVVAGGTLDDGELAVVNAVLPADEIQAAYNGELSDPVKKLWKDTATVGEKRAFFALWLRLGVRHPATYASAFFHNSYGYLTPGYVSTIKPTFIMGMEGRTTLINGVFDFTVNERAETLKTALQSLFACVPFRLLCAPGLYGWLTLFALAGVMGARRRWNAIAVLPALFTLTGCLFSAVNGYFRYAMPLYFLAPVLLALLSQALFSGRRGRKPAGVE